MNSGRNESAPQGVHLDQRSKMAGVTEIISESALGQAGAGGGFHGYHTCVALAFEFAAQVGHHKASEV